MDFDMGKRAGDLRRELRELVAEHVPEHFLGAFTHDPADLETAQRFCRTLAERNLLCLAWPQEFGGGDASVWEQTVVREEMWAAHEPRGAQYMGVNWVGPIIMRHGSAEQQRRDDRKDRCDDPDQHGQCPDVGVAQLARGGEDEAAAAVGCTPPPRCPGLARAEPAEPAFYDTRGAKKL